MRNRIFPIKERKWRRLKILTPNKMLQRLPKALAQVKAGHPSEHLLNQIRQIIHSLQGAKEITKRIYNSIMNSINVLY